MQEWKGTNIEKALVSIHPERFQDVIQVSLSTLFVIGNEVYGSRRNLGSLTLGVQMNKESGDLAYTQDEKGTHAQETVNRIVRGLGAIPDGFAEMPEPKQRQVNRYKKYACSVCGKILRGAGEMGRVVHADDGGIFAQQTDKVVASTNEDVRAKYPYAASTPVATAATPAPQAPVTQDENIQNVIKAVKHGAAKIVHGGRNFGQEIPV